MEKLMLVFSEVRSGGKTASYVHFCFFYTEIRKRGEKSPMYKKFLLFFYNSNPGIFLFFSLSLPKFFNHHIIRALQKLNLTYKVDSIKVVFFSPFSFFPSLILSFNSWNQRHGINTIFFSPFTFFILAELEKKSY